MSQKQPNKGDKPKRYFNFGVGWMNEGGVLTCYIDPKKNARANKDQGYKLFLVPVDGAGDPSGEGIEVSSFKVKQTERNSKTPESAPDYSAYTWEY